MRHIKPDSYIGNYRSGGNFLEPRSCYTVGSLSVTTNGNPADTIEYFIVVAADTCIGQGQLLEVPSHIVAEAD
ncbi:MAG: hypothetical protein IPQ25_09665 [Chitinophagaceae bacterium]|nr:hypothetical protein [Chitinophagaceae bacterium]